jgi:hypothetical protein
MGNIIGKPGHEWKGRDNIILPSSNNSFIRHLRGKGLPEIAVFLIPECYA